MLSFLQLLLFSVFFTQPKYTFSDISKKVYHPPLNIPLVLSANFGELRPNHFHMGLDFKTNGKEGYTLHSIDDGYVSRVTVSPYGYGRVVYINHPGGITSVYAHCQRLTGRLAIKVQDYLMRTRNSEADIYFQPTEIPLQKGETFALSGNSGSSSGPHLHFEIRDSYTEAAINPLFLGLKIDDHLAPTMHSLKIFGLDEFAYPTSGKERTFNLKGKGNSYTVGNGIVELPANFAHDKGGIGFALNGTDRFDAAWNSCGMYGTTLLVNGDTLMHQQLDQVPFEHTRYINAYTDLYSYSHGQKYHKAFHSITNPLQVHKTPSTGTLRIEPGKSYTIQYQAFDFAGNRSTLSFVLKIQEGEKNREPSKCALPNYYNPAKIWTKTWEGASLFLPKNCVLEPIQIDAFWDGTNVKVAAHSLPIVEAFTVRIKALENVPLHQQYLAVKRTHGYSSLTTQVVGEYLEATSKYFGSISVQIDDNGPTIKAVNIGAVVNTKKTTRLVWKMGDYKSGLMNYGLWINDIWHVLDYESKGDYAFFELKDIAPGKYNLRVVALDFCGNESTEEYTIQLE